MKRSSLSDLLTRYNSLIERAGCATLLLACALQIASPFLIRELGYDAFHSLMWIERFPRLFLEGVWYPRWLPEGFGGLGTPTFYFYPPLAFFGATLVRIIAGHQSPFVIYLATAGLATLLSFLSAMYLMRVLRVGRAPAFWMAMLYSFAPFRVYTLYSRSSLSEHFAFVWLPIVFAGVVILLERSNRERGKGLVLVAVGMAALIMSHVPSTAAFAITLPCFAIPYLLAGKIRETAWVAVGGLLGVLIAAIYILPVLHFTPLVQISHVQVTREGMEDVALALFHMMRGIDFTEKSQELVGYIALLIAIIALWRFRSKDKSEGAIRLMGLLLAFLAILFFESTTISVPIWRLLGLNHVIQFPWRFMVPMTLYVVVLVVSSENAKLRSWVNLIVLGWGIGAIFFGSLVDFDLRVHKRDPQRTPFDPPEYVPIHAYQNPANVVRFGLEHQNDPFVIFELPKDTANWVGPVTRIGNSLRFHSHLRPDITDLDKYGGVILHQWYWPTWIMRKDGDSSSVNLVSGWSPDGRAVAKLEDGNHDYTLTLEKSTSELAGEWISGVSLIVLTILAIYFRFRRSDES